MRGGSPMRGSRGGTVIPNRGRGVVQATRGMYKYFVTFPLF